MKIIIFSITEINDKKPKNDNGCHVKNERYIYNHGIEFNASRYGVEVVAYADFYENIKNSSYQNLPVLSIEEIKKYSFDYIILNKTNAETARAHLLSHGINEDKILSFESQRNECLTLFQQGTSVCIRTHSINEQEQQSVSNCFPIKALVSENIPNAKKFSYRCEEIVEAVFNAYKEAKQFDINQAALHVGENWYEFLKRTRPVFYEVIKEHDLVKLGLLLENFYRNEMSTGILGGEEGFKIFINANNYIANFRNIFNTWKNSVNDYDFKKVACPEVGNPYGVLLDGYIVHPNNFLNHYRASFTQNLLSDTNKNTIVEIGGGYGGYAYSLFINGFDGTYVNFDLPENLMVSSYFLKLLFPDKRILCYNQQIESIDNTLLSNYDIILMPHYMVETMPNKSSDLCINTISFSEMDYENIQYYVANFSRIAKKYIYHENMLDGGAGYKFFSESTFPEFCGFKKIFSIPSRWSWFNLNSSMHHHGEFLFERIEQEKN